MLCYSFPKNWIVACRDSASSNEYLNGDRECAVEDWQDIVKIRAAAGITVGVKMIDSLSLLIRVILMV